MSTLLKSATIIDETSPFHYQQKDILIDKGQIVKIENHIEEKKEYKVVSLENLHISSGWFDSSVCFGEPGFEERETISNGLNTAAKSGFTAVAVNPNTQPVIDNKSAVEFLKNKSKGFATSLYPIAALSQGCQGKELSEMYDMQQSGAIAFGDYNKAVSNDNLMKIALLYAQNFDGLVLSFPKNNAIASEGIANEGINSTKLGLKGIPALAEHIQIARDLFILEYTGGRLHVPTISSAKSVALIKDAKKKGLQVSCSVSAHHLTLTDDELLGFDGNSKVSPPLRTLADCKALIKGVKEGVIDMITSDHNPIDIEDKKVEFSAAKDGTIGLESLFGSVNTVIPLEKTIACLTTQAKIIFKLTCNSIAVGQTADLSLFNPETTSIFSKENVYSTSKNSIFFGKKMKGVVYGIFAKNQLVLK
jgi:dihydroorotase|uniref:dihydroorotase n=1 Tax=Polaribacter sp. TaxID=1920175 RepID=UPI0040486287